ncbi:hypothetical protein PR202_ga09771 [Eleusine coracana subsp. coracana]|uniref:BURP domain-containing protein n=1 Tax=Eleusine coracana subsp. coracana TaxID=191504 RepID=A0AAV5C4N4_ELECO|nr:hypothetical protein PR202_ga09771 [Eleusine coracana subsp. coracana]
MGKILAGLLGFLLIASVGSHAARAPEQYWKSALPDTPMPSSLSQLLNTPAGGTTVNVGPGGVHVDAGHAASLPGSLDTASPAAPRSELAKAASGVNVKPGYGKPGGTTVGVGKGGVGVNVQPGHGKPGGTTVGVGKGGVGVHVNPKKKPVYVPVGPFQYMYAASETQLHDDPNGALFFRERDLRAGTKMTLQFGTTAGAGPRFLPRAEAEAVPFSTEEAPEILARFHVYPDSVQAAEMAQTLRDCEARPVEGERKACATSLESMVHFATSSLGTNHVTAVSTVVAKEGSPRQEYAVTGVKPAAGGGTDSLVACHAEPYPYAVFACHMTRATRAYSVSMRGEDGTAVEAVAVCHTDTAGWNPKHLAFQVLKVKPGTVPVCHFLPQDHVVWTRSD